MLFLPRPLPLWSRTGADDIPDRIEYLVTTGQYPWMAENNFSYNKENFEPKLDQGNAM